MILPLGLIWFWMMILPLDGSYLMQIWMMILPAPLVAKLNTWSGLLNPNWFLVCTRACQNKPWTIFLVLFLNFRGSTKKIIKLSYNQRTWYWVASVRWERRAVPSQDVDVEEGEGATWWLILGKSDDLDDHNWNDQVNQVIKKGRTRVNMLKLKFEF